MVTKISLAMYGWSLPKESILGVHVEKHINEKDRTGK